MKIPSDIIKSLSLIKQNEINSVKRALLSLEINNIEPIWKLKKIANTDLYIYRASRTYRIILKKIDNEFEIIDLVHHDKLEKIIITQLGGME